MKNRKYEFGSLRLPGKSQKEIDESNRILVYWEKRKQLKRRK